MQLVLSKSPNFKAHFHINSLRFFSYISIIYKISLIEMIEISITCSFHLVKSDENYAPL